MNTKVSPQKLQEWQSRAAKKKAIVPSFFEVFPDKVVMVCGNCQHGYQRNLIAGLDEPVFVCPVCTLRNWVPVRYNLKHRL